MPAVTSDSAAPDGVMYGQNTVSLLKPTYAAGREKYELAQVPGLISFPDNVWTTQDAGTSTVSTPSESARQLEGTATDPCEASKRASEEGSSPFTARTPGFPNP